MQARPVSESVSIMTEMVLPSHTNSLDSVFGGVIMSWIDICAAISALRHCQRPVVTASIDALNFIAPAYKGWIIILQSSVNFVGRTSMEVGVRVEAEHLVQNEKYQIASAYLTFVALDDAGKPMPIPPVLPQSETEKTPLPGSSNTPSTTTDSGRESKKGFEVTLSQQFSVKNKLKR